ncbi:MAG: PDDEXK nuclease domain-containing protein [Elusimicrobiota bacterium]
MSKIMSVEGLYGKIREILESARSNSYRAVNFAMVLAYWNIGRIIVEEEQKGKNKADYGTYLIKELSNRLRKEYGEGFNETNLKYFRQFYVAFPISHAVRDQSHIAKKGHAVGDFFSVLLNKNLSSKLTWTHYRLLLKAGNSSAREFYINECIEGNWSTRQLERQINSFYYERLLASKNKKAVVKEALKTADKLKTTPNDVIKDPYVLEFLGLKENKKYLELNIEKAIIDKLQEFLLELGKGFCFVARQQRISTESQHFYIDLVFYNYILKCFVLIDLKVGKLTHQDIGQMDMYVRLYEDKIKPEGHNPTIGIILCAEKDETVVKYSVLKENKRLFASKYKLYLPTEAELKKELEKERNLIETEQKLK